MLNILFWGLTFGVIGKVLLGLAVMMVHWRVVKEHGIDKEVIREMRRERNVALIGIVLVVLGYLFELIFYEFTPFSLCGFISSPECGQMLGYIF